MGWKLRVYHAVVQSKLIYRLEIVHLTQAILGVATFCVPTLKDKINTRIGSNIREMRNIIAYVR